MDKLEINKTAIQRSFIVGDVWLYYKIYCGAKTSDIILTSYINPLVCALLKKGFITSWFFIRYTDGGNHIRLRFRMAEIKKIGYVIEAVKKTMQDLCTAGSINAIEIATYNRELERYGTSGIVFAEALFYNDSTTILNALAPIDDEDVLLLFALKNTDNLLTNFGYSTTEKLDFCMAQMDYYKAEFNITKTVNKQLSAKYRLRKQVVNSFLCNIASIKGYEILQVLLGAKNDLDIPIIKKMKIEASALTIYKRLGSFIHMSINRTFRSKQRLYEMLCYDFLVRFYKSEIAKEKYLNQ